MNTITVNFKNTCTSKPTTKSEKINESNNTKYQVQTDPLTFAELMLQGRTWCPATFKGTRSNNNWTSQSVFALDFDSGIQPNIIIERCNELGLIANVVYTSFSDTLELRKFRLVFFLDKVIKDSNKAKELQLTLMELFPECDIACKDGARLFFPGKEIVYVDDQLNNINVVAKFVLDRRLTLRSEASLFTEKVDGVECVVTNSKPAANTKVQTIKSAIRKLNKKNFSFDKAIERIQILADFMDGRWLYNPQLFGLMTNLKYINGGLDLMIKVMNEANKSTACYGQEKFDMIEQVRNGNYKSQRISGFSEYEEDGKWKNVFEACIV